MARGVANVLYYSYEELLRIRAMITVQIRTQGGAAIITIPADVLKNA